MLFAVEPSYKIVLLAVTDEELQGCLLGLIKHFKIEPPMVGEVGGVRIHRLEARCEVLGSWIQLKILGASLGADFQGVYETLFEGAQGALCVIPCEWNRLAESRRLLGLLHSCHLIKFEEGEIPSYALHYQIPEEEGLDVPSAVEMDRLLGLNSQVIRRVCARESEMKQSESLELVFESLISKKTQREQESPFEKAEENVFSKPEENVFTKPEENVFSKPEENVFTKPEEDNIFTV